MKDEEIVKLGIKGILDLITSKKFSAEYITKLYLKQIEKYTNKNAVLEVFDDALASAKKVDEKIKNGEHLGKLAGVPFVIKDNMLYSGHKATCASKFLKNFVSQYTATAVQKLLDNDAVILGRTNMDEFAMGGSNENSAFGVCRNAHSDNHVSGGSSGGSAVAVALDMCACALGTDTGGSVRQPSSFNGTVGVKPTYGRVSRYGIVAFASSLDQVGPITKNVEDNAYLLEILAGEDIRDQTTLKTPVDNYVSAINKDIKGLKIGIIPELMEKFKKSEYHKNFERVIAYLKDNGAQIINVNIPNIDLALPVYYILATAEGSSNLGRFDGVKYTTRASDYSDMESLYANSRTNGFGDEVKRRIMLGNYVLSSGFYDAYYDKAKNVQRYLVNTFDNSFNVCDCIAIPVTYGEAFKIGEKTTDPVSMYLEDMFTVIANISSIPAISVPYSKGKNNLPLGLQILCKQCNESTMYRVADFIEKNYKESTNE